VCNVSGTDDNSDDGDEDNDVINVQGHHQARGGARASTTSSSSSRKVRVTGSPEEERHQHQHRHLDSNASSGASRVAAALQSYYVYCLHYRWLQLYSLLNSDYHAASTTTAIAPLATSDNSNAPVISILPRVPSSSRSPPEVSLSCNGTARGDAEAARITKFNFARLATAAVESPCTTTRSSSSSNSDSTSNSSSSSSSNSMETGRGTNQQQQLMGQRSRSTAKRASR
jgi:hypothetical protein